MKNLFVCILLFAFADVVLAETAFDRGLAQTKQKNYTAAAQSYFLFLSQKDLSPLQRAKTEINLALAIENSGFNQAAVALISEHTNSTDAQIAKRSFEILARLSILANDSVLRNLALKNINALQFNEVTSQEFKLLKIQNLIEKNELDQAFVLTNPEEGEDLLTGSLQKLYLRGLIFLKTNKPELAYQEFEKIYSRISQPIQKSREKALALISMARAKYQSQQFDLSIDLYRKIPKDSEFYRESQMELAWAYFRAARFRSSLGVIETVHTPFYQNYWDPESFLIRAIIHLYACQASPANKAMDQFQKIYQGPTHALEKSAAVNFADLDILDELEEARKKLQNLKLGRADKNESFRAAKLPFSLIRTLMLDAGIDSKLKLLNLVKEQQSTLVNSKRPFKAIWKKDLIVRLNRALQLRKEQLENDLRQSLLLELKQKLADMKDFTTQAEFIRYELLNLQRTELKQKMAAPDSKGKSFGSDYSRKVLVENGYRYWPQSTESWADEVGNTYYLGASRCEK